MTVIIRGRITAGLDEVGGTAVAEDDVTIIALDAPGTIRSRGGDLSAVNGDIVLAVYGSIIVFVTASRCVQHSSVDGDTVVGKDAMVGS